MYRGNLSSSPAPIVAYDFSCVFYLSRGGSFLVKHFPTFFSSFIKVDEEAKKEIESLIKVGYEVEIVMWPQLPRVEHPIAQKGIFKFIRKKFKLPARVVWKESHHEIRTGTPRYEAFYTDRPEVLPFFPSSFVKITFFDKRKKGRGSR